MYWSYCSRRAHRDNHVPRPPSTSATLWQFLWVFAIQLERLEQCTELSGWSLFPVSIHTFAVACVAWRVRELTETPPLYHSFPPAGHLIMI